MRGSSAESYQRLGAQLAAAVEEGADADRLGDDLFATVSVLRVRPTLRRAATDPTTPLQARSDLMRGLFEKHLDKAATDLVAAGGAMRWAASTDLVVALERLGVVAVARAADRNGEADRLEGELFSFGQVIAEHPELREALTDRARSAADKQALLRGLLDGKACAGTVKLAEQAVLGEHGTVRQAFDEFARIATESRGRTVAVVRVARPLDEQAQSRLRDVLARQYGKPVHLDIVLDPSTLGGLQVEVGDDLIDGTIASRLHEARRRLAG